MLHKGNGSIVKQMDSLVVLLLLVVPRNKCHHTNVQAGHDAFLPASYGPVHLMSFIVVAIADRVLEFLEGLFSAFLCHYVNKRERSSTTCVSPRVAGLERPEPHNSTRPLSTQSLAWDQMSSEKDNIIDQSA